jgi:hypothetical protein
VTQNHSLLLKTTYLLSSPKPTLQTMAAACLVGFYQPTSLSNWGSNSSNMVSTFWGTSTQVVRDICIQIYQTRENEESLKQLLELLHRLLLLSSQFMLQNQVCLHYSFFILNIRKTKAQRLKFCKSRKQLLMEQIRWRHTKLPSFWKLVF